MRRCLVPNNPPSKKTAVRFAARPVPGGRTPSRSTYPSPSKCPRRPGSWPAVRRPVLGEAVIYEGLVLIRPADEGPVVSRVGKDVEGLAVFSNLGQLPGRKGLQLLLLDGRLGRDGLKARRDQHILLALGGGAAGAAGLPGLEAPRR